MKKLINKIFTILFYTYRSTADSLFQLAQTPSRLTFPTIKDMIAFDWWAAGCEKGALCFCYEDRNRYSLLIKDTKKTGLTGYWQRIKD